MYMICTLYLLCLFLVWFITFIGVNELYAISFGLISILEINIKTRFTPKQGLNIVQSYRKCEEWDFVQEDETPTHVENKIIRETFWEKQFGRTRRSLDLWCSSDVHNAKKDVSASERKQRNFVLHTLSKLFTLKHYASWSLSKCKTSDQSRWFRLM